MCDMDAIDMDMEDVLEDCTTVFDAEDMDIDLQELEG